MKDILARASAVVVIATAAARRGLRRRRRDRAAYAGIIGSGGTGIGVATGFGSVIVDGVRRDDASARYSSDEDQAELAPIGSTGAMLGQTLEFDDDANGAMTAVRILAAPGRLGERDLAGRVLAPRRPGHGQRGRLARPRDRARRLRVGVRDPGGRPSRRPRAARRW